MSQITIDKCLVYDRQVSRLRSTSVSITIDKCLDYDRQVSRLRSTSVSITIDKCLDYDRQVSRLRSTSVSITIEKSLDYDREESRLRSTSVSTTIEKVLDHDRKHHTGRGSYPSVRECYFLLYNASSRLRVCNIFDQSLSSRLRSRKSLDYDREKFSTTIEKSSRLRSRKVLDYDREKFSTTIEKSSRLQSRKKFSTTIMKKVLNYDREKFSRSRSVSITIDKNLDYDRQVSRLRSKRFSTMVEKIQKKKISLSSRPPLSKRFSIEIVF